MEKITIICVTIFLLALVFALFNSPPVDTAKDEYFNCMKVQYSNNWDTAKCEPLKELIR